MTLRRQFAVYATRSATYVKKFAGVYGPRMAVAARQSAVYATRFAAPVVIGIAIGVAVALASARLG
jgi:hypothetical protein